MKICSAFQKLTILNYATFSKDKTSALAVTYFAHQTVLTVYITLDALSSLHYLKFLSSDESWQCELRESQLLSPQEHISGDLHPQERACKHKD